MKTPENPYIPFSAEITEVTPETPDIKTFRLKLPEEGWSHLPGQFLELSVLGVGECPISISSAPLHLPALDLSIKKIGLVTEAVHDLRKGDAVGIRGPYGRSFPMREWEGRSLLIIGGGIGIAPLRPIIQQALSQRDLYRDISIIYGARSPQDCVYKDQLKEWEGAEGAKAWVTVDRGDETWSGHVGFVPSYLEELAPPPADTVAITCGPPIMIMFVLKALEKLGFTPPQIYTTLEMKMQCGVGICGRCGLGDRYICIDGPVFCYEEILKLSPDLSALK
ncbi:MAG: FAD/NAD(P)-binding protein [Candidatus Eremiobacteraeota bacterium]|nr:FAD/NAD(P)-binding protein [Candidatus Eremiobacteraeota bacterium]